MLLKAQNYGSEQLQVTEQGTQQQAQGAVQSAARKASSL